MAGAGGTSTPLDEGGGGVVATGAAGSPNGGGRDCGAARGKARAPRRIRRRQGRTQRRGDGRMLPSAIKAQRKSALWHHDIFWADQDPSGSVCDQLRTSNKEMRRQFHSSVNQGGSHLTSARDGMTLTPVELIVHRKLKLHTIALRRFIWHLRRTVFLELALRSRGEMANRAVRKKTQPTQTGSSRRGVPE